MKKFCKFLFGTISIVAGATGIYYLYKKFKQKDFDEDFDKDYYDDFDDLYTEEDTDKPAESREYVSIQIDPKKEDENPDTIETTNKEDSNYTDAPTEEDSDDTDASNEESVTE